MCTENLKFVEVYIEDHVVSKRKFFVRAKDEVDAVNLVKTQGRKLFQQIISSVDNSIVVKTKVVSMPEDPLQANKYHTIEKH